MFASLLEIWIELMMHWGRSIDFTSSSCQLLDGYLLQDFSSSPNLVITFLFGNYSVRVNCGKLLYSALARDRVANFLRSSLLISYWLLGFVFASLLKIWMELFMHWGRLTNFTSGSSQLLDGYLLQDFSSSPNFVITFLFGNIVRESTVANSCIGHWHETGLQTFKGCSSSSHIGCLELCLHYYWEFG